MMYVACRCGSGIGLPDDFLGELAECPDCRRTFRVIAAPGTPIIPNEPLDARLTIRSGPQRIGEQFVLRGEAPLEIGKLPDKAISLAGTLVSRNHCRLLRSSDGWRVQDLKSKNGLLVNSRRVETTDLNAGDRIQIGDYELEYSTGVPEPQGVSLETLEEMEDSYELAEEPAVPRPIASQKNQTSQPVKQALGVDPCPSCGTYLPANAVICVNCGINIRTGRAILVSRDVDENAVHATTETTVRAISWLLPFGLYPVTSEGYGSSKPYAVWSIAALTTLVTILVWIINLTSPTGPSSTKNMMLWCGRQPTTRDIARGYLINLHTHWGDSQAFEQKVEQLETTMPKEKAIDTAYKQLPPDQQFYGEFHWYQLITNGLLHGGILHLAGNLLFLLVFGSRVNALIGQWKTAVLYPVLLIVASWAEMTSLAGKPPLPALGASGAIMGLAGMYFVLFPVHRVFMVIWLRLGLLLGFRLAYKIFALRGFWVVLFYLAFDVLATVLGSRDGVAHWAHLGGFIGGMLLALILLLARQIDAHGGDLLSALLGQRAWLLLGKPGARALACVPAAAVP